MLIRANIQFCNIYGGCTQRLYDKCCRQSAYHRRDADCLDFSMEQIEGIAAIIDKEDTWEFVDNYQAKEATSPRP